MFRNDMGDVSLFESRSAVGPKPSFRPAVEALEERTVLASDVLAPSTHTPMFDATVNNTVLELTQLTQMVNSFSRTLTRKLTQYLKSGRGESAAIKLLNQATNMEKLVKAAFDGVINQQSRLGTASDPAVAQARQAFNAAIQQFDSRIGKVQVLRNFYGTTHSLADFFMNPV